ncbi:MAG: glycoside hydrolase family 5 protein [Treponema sp.]|jgi:endoglucanase|nr:glycoside hydrolase family 5 protein [Treponema sp.]
MKIFKTLFMVTFVTALVMCRAGSGKYATGNQEYEDMLKNIPENIIESLPVNPSVSFVRNMGIGINIGNTLDAIGNAEWVAGETGWGNPMITREFIRALKGFGYTTIRLPVTWAEYIGDAPDFFIQEGRMSRVEEVVNWILDEGLYCILNLHHDGGESDRSWILNAASDPDRIANQLAAVWKQIARRFSGVSQEQLVFESMNEVGFDKLWNRYGNGTGGKSEAFGILNMLNQTFVNTVRGTAGNEDRFLLIAGYWTDINQSCDPLFQMPKDTIENRLILSVHYYDPSTFCIADRPDNSWGFRDDWGTDSDYVELAGQFNKLRVSFLGRGVPVILGEYGVTLRNKVEQGRVRWMAAVTQTCLNYGICPVLWDTGGEISRRPPYGMRDSLKEVWAVIAK